ncbi:chromate efflux transporter [Pacificoceanicola onchidii]|uniref:chromate efflux transporter n=1 Tax=Pacificoceanicola onchidii TaxID=2562685 RepID=UPI001F0D368D|nr:chromate efflux transporter [Pacificoceanicola onchidii]
MTPIPLSTLFGAFLKVGLLSFGGPAAQIAVMHRELVEERRWLSEEQFLRSLSFCMLLPGPEAMQLATYAGWRLRGVPGGLIAGLLFVLPGALVIALLALLYTHYGATPAAQAPLLGIKACVLVIVAQALWRLSRKALKTNADRLLALGAFIALYSLSLPFPLVIAVAAVWGAFAASNHNDETTPTAGTTPWQTLVVFAILWLAPLPVLYALGQTFLLDLALFFGKLAVVTFGGAYAVLAYMAQEVVEARNWLTAPQMIDALGLAETTPGPLILVTQFVGMLSGAAQGGTGLALTAGALTLWMTFLPCFLWIFAGAPHLESLLARPRLRGALQAVTASVVGVIANLSLWFALGVLFSRQQDTALGRLPDFTSLQAAPLLFIALAAGILWIRPGAVPLAVAVCAGLAGLGALL